MRPRGEEEDPRPSKTQRRDDQQEEEDLVIDHLMEALEEAESDTIHQVSTDCSMPLITCDEPLDVSFMGLNSAKTSPTRLRVRGMGRYVKPLGTKVSCI